MQAILTQVRIDTDHAFPILLYSCGMSGKARRNSACRLKQTLPNSVPSFDPQSSAAVFGLQPLWLSGKTPAVSTMVHIPSGSEVVHGPLAALRSLGICWGKVNTLIIFDSCEFSLHERLQ